MLCIMFFGVSFKSSEIYKKKSSGIVAYSLVKIFKKFVYKIQEAYKNFRKVRNILKTDRKTSRMF